MPAGQEDLPYANLHIILDGLAIEMLWITEKNYIQEVKEISPSWYGVGAEVLQPITSPEFVQRISNHQPSNKRDNCLKQAFNIWPAIYFSSKKVFEVTTQKDHEKISLAVYHAFENILSFLSFINQVPFTSSSKKIVEAKEFKLLPKGFLKLLDIIINGKFMEYESIHSHFVTILHDSKEYLIHAGYEIPDRYQPKKCSDLFGMRDESRRYEQILDTWGKVQESTTKTLNAAESKNAHGMATVINDMFFQYMKVISCLNSQTISFSQIIDDAKNLKYLPEGFPRLIDIIKNGEYKEFAEIKKLMISIFTELENKIAEEEYDLYPPTILLK